MAGDQRYSREGTTRDSLDEAWRDRLADADALYQAGRYAASISSGLYALEILLKVLICDLLDRDGLPRAFEIHDLEGLLVLSGKSRRLLRYQRGSGLRVRSNWDSIRNASSRLNDLRYSPASSFTEEDARVFRDQLIHPRFGVISWLQKQK